MPKINWNYVLNVIGKLLVSGAVVALAVGVFGPMLAWVWEASSVGERAALVLIGTMIVGVMLIVYTE